MTESVDSLKSFDKETPSVVEPVSQLKDDLFALESLLEGDVPRRSQVRLPKS